MPVKFLTETQKKHYGRLTGELSPVELARYFHMDDKDRALINKRRGNHNRLGFGLQLGTVRYLGTFLPNPIDVPDGIIDFVACQINITKADGLIRYMVLPATFDARLSDIRDWGARWIEDLVVCCRLVSPNLA